MSAKKDLIFVEHILDSINAIDSFSKNLSEEELATNRMKRDAIVKEIEIIGEASKNISNSLKEKYREIEWTNIVRARDKMVHHYFGIDLEIVLGIVKDDLPILKRQVQKILIELK